MQPLENRSAFFSCLVYMAHTDFMRSCDDRLVHGNLTPEISDESCTKKNQHVYCTFLVCNFCEKR